MENLTNIGDMRKLRNEQERERRRLRDRERRQAMTVEERERHLARRRRNYQLRRQKAENGRVADPQFQLPRGNVMLLTNHQDPSGSDSSSAVRVGSDHVQIVSNIGAVKLSVEVPANKVTGRVRLTQVKNLARSLHKPADETAVDETAVCALANGLRLSQVKQLARSIHSPVKENGTQELDNTQTETPVNENGNQDMDNTQTETPVIEIGNQDLDNTLTDTLVNENGNQELDNTQTETPVNDNGNQDLDNTQNIDVTAGSDELGPNLLKENP